MRTVRLALCLAGIATLYPAVSNAAHQVCASAFVPAATPQWKTGCDGQIAGTTGHSWGVTIYSVALDASVPGSICYDVYTPHGWVSGCDGLQLGFGTDAIRQFEVSGYTGAGTVQYRPHVGNVGWLTPVNMPTVVGQTNQTLQALEVNVHLSSDPAEFWQQT